MAQSHIHTDSAQPMDPRDYRRLMKSVSDNLKRRDVSLLKFLCADLISLSKLERMKDGIPLMLELENSALLSASDCSLLAELLVRLHRHDIVHNILGLDPQQIKSRINSPDYVSRLSRFRLLLHQLTLDIPPSSVSTLKFVFADSLPRSSLEGVKDVCSLLALMESQQMITPGDISVLYTMIETADLKNLKEVLDEYQATSPSSGGEDFQKVRLTQSYLARQIVGGDQTTEAPPSYQSVTQQTSLRPKHSQQERSAAAPGTAEAQTREGITRLHITEPVVPTDPAPQSSGPVTIQSPVQVSDDNPPPHPFWLQQPHGNYPSPTSRPIVQPPEFAPEVSLGSNYNPSSGQVIHQPPSLPDPDIQTSGSSIGDTLAEDLVRSNSQTAMNRMTNQPAGFDARHTASANQDSLTLECYKMESVPRGFCVIINNETFTHNAADKQSKKLDNRPGTKKDRDRLEALFTRLGFNVRVLDNKTAEQIENHLQKLSQYPHEDKDTLAVCILSHGDYGAVYGTDGHKVKIPNILRHFKADRCPSLAGKPKLFFLQACQGKTKQEGVRLHVDAPRPTTPPETRTAAPDNDRTGDTDLVPNDADFLVGYATVPGYVSYRHEDSGTWYIELLVKQIHKLCHRHDLLSIMTSVSNEVTKKTAPLDNKLYKQVPLPYTTLTKQVYLHPVH